MYLRTSSFLLTLYFLTSSSFVISMFPSCIRDFLAFLYSLNITQDLAQSQDLQWIILQYPHSSGPFPVAWTPTESQSLWALTRCVILHKRHGNSAAEKPNLLSFEFNHQTFRFSYSPVYTCPSTSLGPQVRTHFKVFFYKLILFSLSLSLSLTHTHTHTHSSFLVFRIVLLFQPLSWKFFNFPLFFCTNVRAEKSKCLLSSGPNCLFLAQWLSNLQVLVCL